MFGIEIRPKIEIHVFGKKKTKIGVYITKLEVNYWF
jgi:hypothetical protein